MMQLVIYGLISGSIITLGAIGLSLTYGILGFANFAHGDIMALGSYIAFVFLGLFSQIAVINAPLGPLSFGAGLLIAMIIAMILTAIAAILLDKILYKKLRSSSSITLLIAAVGVSLSLRNLIQFIWGPQPKYYIRDIQLMRKIPGIDAKIKPDQIFIFAVSMLLVLLVHLFLKNTKMGKAMRAASDNMELARITGIDTERVIMWTWGIGSALAAAAGVLMGIENKLIVPSAGWDFLLPLFAAVILGGIGSPYGAMLGGMIIGLSSELSTAFISTSYKPAVAFVILVLMLLVRPRGLLGGKG